MSPAPPPRDDGTAAPNLHAESDATPETGHGADIGFSTDIDGPSAASAAVSAALVLARVTLLDALDALEEHTEAFTLIGAQAVYEHTKHYRDAPPTLTNDGDMAVNHDLVSTQPDIAAALRGAGFVNHPDRPGIWIRQDGSAQPPSVDLLAPEATAGKGRRSTHVHGQDKTSVGRAAGLEMASLDRAPMRLESFGDAEPVRSRTLHVAGPAALLCAKAYKLAERVDAATAGARDRVKAKDAGDVWRLMATTDPLAIRTVFATCEQHPTLGPAASLGREYLTRLFSDGGPGTDLAVIDLADALGEQRIRDTMSTWMQTYRR